MKTYEGREFHRVEGLIFRVGPNFNGKFGVRQAVAQSTSLNVLISWVGFYSSYVVRILTPCCNAVIGGATSKVCMNCTFPIELDEHIEPVVFGNEPDRIAKMEQWFRGECNVLEAQVRAHDLDLMASQLRNNAWRR